MKLTKKGPQKALASRVSFLYAFFMEGLKMDNNLLCQKLMEREDIMDIPAIHVLKVAIAALEIINSGECFFDAEEKSDVC